MLVEMGFDPTAVAEELDAHRGNMQGAIDALLVRRSELAPPSQPPTLPPPPMPARLVRQLSADLRATAAAAAAAASAVADATAASEGAAAGDTPCLICMSEDGTPRAACGHAFCAECFLGYIKSRIGERRVLDLPCPAVASTGCPSPDINASEVAKLVSPDDLRRYEEFVQSERAEVSGCVKNSCIKRLCYSVNATDSHCYSGMGLTLRLVTNCRSRCWHSQPITERPE